MLYVFHNFSDKMFNKEKPDLPYLYPQMTNFKIVYVLLLIPFYLSTSNFPYSINHRTQEDGPVFVQILDVQPSVLFRDWNRICVYCIHLFVYLFIYFTEFSNLLIVCILLLADDAAASDVIHTHL